MCSLPPLLLDLSEQDYRIHYEHEYCLLGPISTFDHIPVYFGKGRFNHAFYRPANRHDRKDTFCTARAERMPWIKATLENPFADLFQGWIAATRSVEPARRVAVMYNDYVVVIELSLKRTGTLKANFVTAFLMEDGTEKIRVNPKWDPAEAMRVLQSNKKGR